MDSKELKFVCTFLYRAYKIPSMFIKETKELAFEFPGKLKEHPLYDYRDIIDKLLIQDVPDTIPYIMYTDYQEWFIVMKIIKANSQPGYVILGPVISPDYSPEMIVDILSSSPIDDKMLNLIHIHYQALLQLPFRKLFDCAIDLHYLIYQEIIDISDIHYNPMEFKMELEEPTMVIMEKREALSFHHDIKYEQKLLQFISKGNKEELIKLFRSFPDEKVGSLSKNNYLRSRKNIGIVVITLAVRAAIEGGLHYELGYTLSDTYIKNIEELENVQQINILLENALIDLADRVKNNKIQNYSKPIIECLSYIYLNLYEHISLEKVATVVNLHPNYLSRLFNKEVGMSLREYIHHLKIEEATKLMVDSNYSISKISTILNFNDQSHFSKVFKKIHGITPKQYQKGVK